MMLQEELSVPLASELALLGCHKYALTGEPSPWEPQPPDRDAEPEEEVKVHVEYLPNGYHDDHFDLDGERDLLLGKTIALLSRKAPTGEASVDLALEMLGWTLFQKVLLFLCLHIHTVHKNTRV